jgi:hypothetical protein
MGSGLKTGRRIFYLKVEKGTRVGGGGGGIKNFFDFAVYKILHVPTVTIVYEHWRGAHVNPLAGRGVAEDSGL